MKLITFNNETLPKQNGGGPRKPRVTFNKAGVISFNGAACELMELGGGKKVSLSQDEESPEDWYFHIDEKNGYELRYGYDKKGCMFNHSLMIKEFNKVFEFDDETSRGFSISKVPAVNGKDKTKYWCVLINKNDAD